MYAPGFCRVKDVFGMEILEGGKGLADFCMGNGVFWVVYVGMDEWLIRRDKFCDGIRATGGCCCAC